MTHNQNPQPRHFLSLLDLSPEELHGLIQRATELKTILRSGEIHESLKNLTPADVYQGRGREIQIARERLKQQTLRRRRRYNRGLQERKEELILPSIYRGSVS